MHFVNDIDKYEWNRDGIHNAIVDACAKTGVKPNKIMPILRTLIAAGIAGPDMLSMMSILSKAEIAGRIYTGLNIPEFQS